VHPFSLTSKARSRLVGLARAAWVDRNAGEILGVIGDLEGVAGIVGGEIGNEDERLAGALLLVVDRDVVDFHLGHLEPPRAMQFVTLRWRGKP
jgi:hypothetical protein